MNRKMYWWLGALVVLLIASVVYMIPVQQTQILLLKSELLLADNTSKVPDELNYMREMIFSILIFLLQLGYMGGLLFLAIRTKSKGITLFFLIEAIGKLASIITGVLTVYLVSKSLSYPSVMKIVNYTQGITFAALYLLGIYILYKEYKAGKLIPRQASKV
ncbi:MAG: hypothetical protein OXM61_07565 [Candidatus Poribacteria bacterium]|nr:hypothetical protein [Candidatus Poribacteria bacterium]